MQEKNMGHICPIARSRVNSVQCSKEESEFIKTQIGSEVVNVCNTNNSHVGAVIVYIATLSVVLAFLLQSANLRLTKLMTMV